VDSQPETLDLIDREMTRGRLRQKLNAVRARIERWEAELPNCENDRARELTRRWMEGMIRHWRNQARELEERLGEVGGEGDR
jgi:hypothetical protein